MLAACALSAHAAAVLRCDVSYAGTTHHITARPVADPYGVESVDIGGRPDVMQNIGYHRGKPIVYSVGNSIMEETDNAKRRTGCILRLERDRWGVQYLGTCTDKP